MTRFRTTASFQGICFSRQSTNHLACDCHRRPAGGIGCRQSDQDVTEQTAGVLIVVSRTAVDDRQFAGFVLRNSVVESREDSSFDIPEDVVRSCQSLLLPSSTKHSRKESRRHAVEVRSILDGLHVVVQGVRDTDSNR